MSNPPIFNPNASTPASHTISITSLGASLARLISLASDKDGKPMLGTLFARDVTHLWDNYVYLYFHVLTQ